MVKVLLSGIAVFLIFIAIIMSGTELNLFMGKKYKKQFKDVERNAYEGSKSYVKGVASDLSNYKFEYDNSTSETEKIAIKRLILNRFADFKAEDLNNRDLQNFLKQMRGY